MRGRCPLLDGVFGGPVKATVVTFEESDLTLPSSRGKQKEFTASAEMGAEDGSGSCSAQCTTATCASIQ